MSSRHAKKNQTKFIQLERHLCNACWDCIDSCPKDVLKKMDLLVHRHVVIRNAEACNGCKKCVRACETGALVYTYSPHAEGAVKPI